jgi:hypothetical protein
MRCRHSSVWWCNISHLHGSPSTCLGLWGNRCATLEQETPVTRGVMVSKEGLPKTTMSARQRDGTPSEMALLDLASVPRFDWRGADHVADHRRRFGE